MQAIKRTQSDLSKWFVKKGSDTTASTSSSSKPADPNIIRGTVTITVELDESHALGIVGQMVSVRVQA